MPFLIDYIAIGICLALVGTGLFCIIYSMFDYDNYPKCGKLDKDATITDVSTKRFNKYKFKTVLTFSDGYKYKTFKTNSQKVGINKTQISVDSALRSEFAKKAIEKHNKRLEQQIEKGLSCER